MKRNIKWQFDRLLFVLYIGLYNNKLKELKPNMIMLSQILSVSMVLSVRILFIFSKIIWSLALLLFELFISHHLVQEFQDIVILL